MGLCRAGAAQGGQQGRDRSVHDGILLTSRTSPLPARAKERMSGDGWPQVGTGGAVHGARDLSGHNGAVDRKMGAVDRGTGQYHRMMAMASAMLMGRRLAAVVGIRAGVRIVKIGRAHV